MTLDCVFVLGMGFSTCHIATLAEWIPAPQYHVRLSISPPVASDDPDTVCLCVIRFSQTRVNSIYELEPALRSGTSITSRGMIIHLTQSEC